jgi:hypothetical protein
MTCAPQAGRAKAREPRTRSDYSLDPYPCSIRTVARKFATPAV